MCTEVNKKNAIIKFSLFILFLLIIIIIVSQNANQLLEIAKRPDDIRNYMLSNGMFGAVLFLIIQIIHVIIVIIPGDILYVLGGFIFGLPIGFLLSYVGIMIGAVIVFNLSRLLGYDFVSMIISKENIDKMNTVLNSVKGMMGLFFICLLPMVSKSLLMYVAGLTPIKASRLFFVYALSRIPIIFIWTAIGANMYEQNFLQMFITLGILVVLSISSLIMQTKIFKKS